MNSEVLTGVPQLAAKAGHAFVATVDANGWPHVAVAGRLAVTPEEHLVVTDWFCPVTMANLRANPKLSVVVWDSASDVGYQLIGELEETKDLGVLNGYAPPVESDSPIPQVERQLLVHIDRILDFKHAPHTDGEKLKNWRGRGQ